MKNKTMVASKLAMRIGFNPLRDVGCGLGAGWTKENFDQIDLETNEISCFKSLSWL
jgi:hypothetical protein